MVPLMRHTFGGWFNQTRTVSGPFLTGELLSEPWEQH